MNYRLISAWAVLLALAASLAISPIAVTGSSSSEDRNFDGQADVWQFYDEGGRLVMVMRDQNFDGYVDAREVIDGHHVLSRAVDQNFDRQFDLSFTGTVAAEPDVTVSVAPQPFLLSRAAFVGDLPIQDRALVILESSSESHSAASPSGRAPPAAL